MFNVYRSGSTEKKVIEGGEQDIAMGKSRKWHYVCTVDDAGVSTTITPVMTILDAKESKGLAIITDTMLMACNGDDEASIRIHIENTYGKLSDEESDDFEKAIEDFFGE